MIKKWNIKNFKSFRNPPELKFNSINILAGANSSGKSSIIQSILLLKQTIQYGAPDRSLALNGPLLRMGEFSDVRNFDAENETLSIAFDLDVNQGTSSAPIWPRQSLDRIYAQGSTGLQTISVEAEFRQFFGQEPDGGLKNKIVLQRSSLYSTYDAESLNEPACITLTTKALPFGPVDPDYGANPFRHFNVEIDDESLAQISANRPNLTIEAGIARHFLPDLILFKYDAAAQKANELASFLCTPHSNLAKHSNLGNEVISPVVINVLNEWLSKKNFKVIDVNDSIIANDVRQIISSLPGNIFSWSSLVDQKKSDRQDFVLLRTLLSDALLVESTKNLTYDLDIPRITRISSDYVKDFFRQGVRYLGPLRDAPRPVYPLEALESTTDVGYRGEHTAAVFQLNSDKFVSMHQPPGEGFEFDYVTDAEKVTISLHDATVSWLAYLGVADEVKSTDSGVFGNRLQVATDNLDRWHDLTNVGVGVSQVLPLVVTALLAKPGSLLIFEQPELHLHPRVQARLADFFLALALDGKQMLLETHSEYLIDRFRLRIALSDADAVRPLLSILFTEKENGQSVITPVQVTEFGAIENWPKDFFDQSQKDIARLLKAAAKRRSKSRH
ncbi:DUF3696 domain-containing protein [Agrobacterium vitis]|uniref:AAA family ATPase n=1 Tax=Agrobacterium vitis TaxID=373 RepID=UPI0012E9625D|nr:DUF3696 domain-containing protein [Agrobacterium vitis]MVA27829.1 DUF3696 domain-containing protein [Agrobacterium vitis]